MKGELQVEKSRDFTISGKTLEECENGIAMKIVPYVSNVT
jgi:hypothetical protein